MYFESAEKRCLAPISVVALPFPGHSIVMADISIRSGIRRFAPLGWTEHVDLL